MSHSLYHLNMDGWCWFGGIDGQLWCSTDLFRKDPAFLWSSFVVLHFIFFPCGLTWFYWYICFLTGHWHWCKGVYCVLIKYFLARIVQRTWGEWNNLFPYWLLSITAELWPATGVQEFSSTVRFSETVKPGRLVVCCWNAVSFPSFAWHIIPFH